MAGRSLFDNAATQPNSLAHKIRDGITNFTKMIMSGSGILSTQTSLQAMSQFLEYSKKSYCKTYSDSRKLLLYLLSKHEEHLADHRMIPLSNQAERDFFQDQEQYEQWLAEAEKHIDRWVAEDESLVIKRNDVHSLRHRLNMEAERVERELLDGDEKVESEEESEAEGECDKWQSGYKSMISSSKCSNNFSGKRSEWNDRSFMSQSNNPMNQSLLTNDEERVMDAFLPQHRKQRRENVSMSSRCAGQSSRFGISPPCSPGFGTEHISPSTLAFGSDQVTPSAPPPETTKPQNTRHTQPQEESHFENAVEHLLKNTKRFIEKEQQRIMQLDNLTTIPEKNDSYALMTPVQSMMSEDLPDEKTTTTSPEDHVTVFTPSRIDTTEHSTTSTLVNMSGTTSSTI